eukprot:CAMPEP_0172715032 /NCGR_PEP_ID=MMETSP1074-20121228/67311_1 /TAXON_ID=2916 /ORGANISM="Ceratium fusus, Strain PA161109" /LENGTH=45 /DNA_ID= /DNA_START= /DNA_END= /DNA_ORIENTATION=
MSLTVPGWLTFARGRIRIKIKPPSIEPSGFKADGNTVSTRMTVRA